ncbi:MAG: lytic transglycosylase domain-containing protein [Candidatus Electronema sp. V4]|uniref:lytic transglycosylase domain-containing protein n=1 Tax=Candidatus Electronema sp. V4 TaxID=3454756 RepID=UPI0040559615
MLSAVKQIVFACLVLTAAPATAEFQLPQNISRLPAPQLADPATLHFPVYALILPNVEFWEKIYGVYSENQGVLHDRRDLRLIYGVIRLMPKDTLGAGKINEKLTEVAQLHVKGILNKFAGGGGPQTAEELRIHSLFQQKSPAAFLAAAENIRVQTGLKNRFREGVIRSGAYMPAIKRILRMLDLPLELAYLPHVESSFNPKAHSKAGAVGLWQFTRYTGKEFMTVNELVDERYDLYIASEAAARFLKENHRQLGAWPLALTAYNHGRGGMLRAKAQWGSYPVIFANHTNSTFGFASRNFYPEFLAALRVARRLEADFSVIKERPLISASLRLKGYAAAAELRQYFGVSEEEFRRLNPALIKPVLEGKKYIPIETIIHLPATHFIRERIRSMPQSLLRASQIPDYVPPPPKLKRPLTKAAVSKKAAGRFSQKMKKAKVKARPVLKKKAKRKR